MYFIALTSVESFPFFKILLHDLVAMVVLSWQLDLKILEVFSNLWFYDLKTKLFIFHLEEITSSCTRWLETDIDLASKRED